MKTVAYTNKTKQTQNIGGKTIQPMETREIDARFVPSPSVLNRELMILYINFDDSPRYFGTQKVDAKEPARLSIVHFENPNREDAGAVQDEIFETLLSFKVDIVKEYFSVLEDVELHRLIEIESQGQNRKSMLNHIEDEFAVRLAEREFSPGEYAKMLEALSDEDLDLEVLAAIEEVKIEMVENELSKRKEAKDKKEG